MPQATAFLSLSSSTMLTTKYISSIESQMFDSFRTLLWLAFAQWRHVFKPAIKNPTLEISLWHTTPASCHIASIDGGFTAHRICVESSRIIWSRRNLWRSSISFPCSKQGQCQSEIRLLRVLSIRVFKIPRVRCSTVSFGACSNV